MLPEKGRVLFAHKGGKPEPSLKARGVDFLHHAFQPVGELLCIRFQPVAHLGLPAIVDLEQVSWAKQAAAAGQILPDGILGDVLIAVVPTGIARQLLFGPGLDAHSLKPAVEHFGFAALGKKEVEQSKAAAGMLHPGAVPLQRQQGFAAVVAEDGVARGLVQRCHQPELRSPAEIAVGKAVALPLLMPIRRKMIIAVAVKGIFFAQKAGNVVGAAQLAVPVQLRAVGPCLVAVHEQTLVCFHRPRHLGTYRLQRPGGQVGGKMHRTAARVYRGIALPHTAGSFRVPVQCLSHGALPPRGAVR